LSRRLKLDMPGPDWRIPLEALGGLPVGCVLEIGFGRGEFLIDLARRAPECCHLGVEVSRKRVLKMARRLARSELENVRLVEAPAERVLAELPPASVREAWINFPDPWPKKRHHRRRLLQSGFARELACRLEPGAALHVATDHVEYAEQIDMVLSSEPSLENRAAPVPWLPEVSGRVRTAYELEWRAEGRRLHFFEYRRSPA
jgi:tRNA (guanine-N7-)-methyltransferase